MTIHYSKQGKGQALVLFHGWGFDSSIWDSLVADLADDFETYCVDLPGFGNSPLMDWQDFKQQLLHHLPEHFSVLGWSLGGLYATRLAVEAEQRTKHLINVASTPRFIGEEQWPGIEPTVFDGFYRNILTAPDKVLEQFMLLQSKGQDFSTFKGKTPEKDSLEQGLKILATWDLRQELKYFKKPASFIFGRLDAITPAKTLTVMQEYYPRFNYLLIKKSAHMPFLSHRQEFVSAVRGFLL